jgi:folate-binding Fe-S cluster repair protein YgfZ
VNGINFRKGCYTGQEIVARMHYRGKLKRHMYRFSIATDQNPLVGTPVINKTTGHIAGQIIMAARTNSLEIEVLASVLDEQLEELTIQGIPQKLKQLPLPYAIPTADEKTE